MSAAIFPTIATDTPCCICQYNLKGLAPDSNCPECGQPISRTFRFDLTHADPAWLRLQMRTMPLLLALCMINFTPTLSFYARWIDYPIKVVLAGINVWACWRLARHDPAAPPDEDGTLRRGTILASAFLAIIVVFEWPDDTGLRSTSSAKFLLYSVALMLNDFLTLMLVTRLARRSGDPALLRWATVAMWGFASVQAAHIVASRMPAAAIYEYAMMVFAFVNYAAHGMLLLTLFVLGWMFSVLREMTVKAQERVASLKPMTQPPPSVVPGPGE